MQNESSQDPKKTSGPFAEYGKTLFESHMRLDDCMVLSADHVKMRTDTKLKENGATEFQVAVHDSVRETLVGFNSLHERMDDSHKIAIGAALGTYILSSNAVSFKRSGMQSSIRNKMLLGTFVAGMGLGITGATFLPKLVNKLTDAGKSVQQPPSRAGILQPR